MGLPKDPRGMMINLMYLVLTAMLALNITREVLNAFNTIDESIVRSNEAIQGKNTDIYQMLNDMEENPTDRAKVEPINAIAKQVRAHTEDMLGYLEGWKDSIINASGGYTIENGQEIIKKMDNIQIPTKILVKEKGGNAIKESLEEYLATIKNLIPSESFKSIFERNSPVRLTELPQTDDNPRGDWATGTFNNIPVVATVTMFSKFQNDVRNTEAMVLEHLVGEIYAQDYKFDGLEALAIPSTTYALVGDEIEATIMLAAYNKSASPIITSSAGPVRIENGIGRLKIRASGTGERTVTGSIQIDKDGEVENYPYSFKYMVGSAGASLQLDKMNVMYIGIPNPVTISASGYNIEDVTFDIPGAKKTTTGPGKYDVEVEKIAELEYVISAGRGGNRTPLERGKIRTKYVPDPVARMIGQSSGTMNTGRAKSALGIIAELDDFPFDLRYEIVSFTFYWLDQNGETFVSANSTGAFNQTSKDYINRSRAGDRWIFDNVRAKGPDGRVRLINSITITLN
ncbi:MAG TPA: gliding motility protein GldM [Chitinophagaceae bacterium]|nr:gliding motility protein GldM [Chitinophagaceae bacterium]